MKPSSLLILVVLALVVGACSRKTDVQGTWKSREGSILVLTGDSLAEMKQEGLDGGTRGTYHLNGDTLTVREEPYGTDMDYSFNEFVFLLQDEALALKHFSRHRGNDVGMQTVEQLATMTGRPVDQFIFRREGASEAEK